MIEEVVRQAEYLFDSLMRVQPATTPRWWEQTSQKGTEKGAAAKGSGKGPGKSAGKAKGKGSKRGYDAAFGYPQEAPGMFYYRAVAGGPPPWVFYVRCSLSWQVPQVWCVGPHGKGLSQGSDCEGHGGQAGGLTR